MNSTRSLSSRRTTIGIVTFAAMLVVAGSATSEAPSETASASPQRAVEVDLTGAHLDKRKFLAGLSMLGKSVEQDVEILRKMTGHTFNPKPMQGRFPDGERRFRETAPLFKNSPMFISGTYWYRIYEGNRFHSSVGIVFDQKAECISAQDLEAVLGAPTRVISAKEAAGKGLGPSPIWTIIYVYPTGGSSVFAFSTSLCANDVTFSSLRK